MAVEAVQSYVDLVFGLTKVTRKRAAEAAKSLLAQAGLDDVAADAGERVTKLAEELVNASRANRALLEKVIRAEVDKAASSLGFVRAQDVEELRREIADLRSMVSRSSDDGGPSVRVSPASEPPPTAAPTRKAAAKRSAAKKAAANRGVAGKSGAAPGGRNGAE